MTSYSTLKEAYNVDSFGTLRKKTRRPQEVSQPEHNTDTSESFLNDYSPQDDCYYKKEYGVDTKVCRSQGGANGVNGVSGANGANDTGNANVISRFTNPTPQGAQQQIAVQKKSSNPLYVENSKLSMNSTEVHGYKSHQMNTQGNSCSPLQAPNYQYPISGECKKEFDKTMKTYTDDSTINNMSYEDFNKGVESKNIQPYYDEDLEQYFDITNLSDAVNYKSSSNTSYMPNANNSGYANDNTGEYRNMQTKTAKSGDDLLSTEAYNLSDEDKKQALQALSVLQAIEEKIKEQNVHKARQEQINGAPALAPASKPDTKPDEKKDEKKDAKPTSSFYNNLINIGLFIFIGVVFILLCDQITELAIQIGMKRAVSILEPYLQKVNNVVPSNTGSISEITGTASSSI
jgi:hypothetical protein